MEGIFETRHSKDFGRYLVSKKDFCSGDRVFVEDPLIVCPFTGGHSNIPQGEYICYGCNKIIKRSEALHCETCRWYACSEECLFEPWHTNFECQLFSQEDIIPTHLPLKYLYLVRSLKLKAQDVASWKEILKMSSAIAVEDHELNIYHEKHAKIAHAFLTKQCLFDVDKDLILLLIQIFFINKFSLGEADRAGNRYKGGAVFATGCILSHSCTPNINWVIMPTNEAEGLKRWQLNLYARKNIKAGEMLTIAYEKDFLSFGTMQRRLTIVNTFHFACKCARCTDPYEFDTNYSAIACPNCPCPGAVLPVSPLDFLTHWECRICRAEASTSKAKKLENIFDKAYKLITKSVFEDQDRKCEKMDALIKECSSKYGLHKNNNRVIQAKVYWLKHIDMDILMEVSERADQMYALIMERAKNCLQVASAIGELYSWDTCERVVAKSIVRYKLKSTDLLSIESVNYTLTEKISILEQILKHAGRALRLLKPSAKDDKLRDLCKQLISLVNNYRENLTDADKNSDGLQSSATTDNSKL